MSRTIVAGVFAAGLLAALTASSAPAANGDCAQPVSAGDRPVATDCLFILRASVSLETCDPECVCDTNDSGSRTATDALICLQFAVNTPGVELMCPGNCPPVLGNGCTSAELFALSGSDLDTGWTGLAHDSAIVEGASITFQVLRRCSGDNSVCLEDSDCAGQGTCEATCDCENDTLCEATGPTTQKRCLNALTPCSIDDNCPGGQSCEDVFGPPLPLSSGGTGTCVVTLFEEPITGTVDSATGEGLISAVLRSRVFLGDVDKPCPRCGEADQNPEVGDVFTCNGGPNSGNACTVDAVSPLFGGVSFQCPPATNANVSGVGLAIRFNEITTGTATQQAELPCDRAGFREHPSRGNGICTDDFSSCDTNADCMRCDGDETISCMTNGDCGESGPCATGPDVSVSCGFYCHCGFCEETASGIQDPDLPCNSNDQCPNGFTCEPGNSSGEFNKPQAQPNNCNSLRCGSGANPEECATTINGFCSDEPFRSCSVGSTQCEIQNAGTCEPKRLPCFEGEISRSGIPSPLGSYCSGGGDSDAPCTSNTDCSEGVCTPDSSRATTASLFCVGSTAASAVNSAAGITGPGAIGFKNFIKTCRCGDGVTGCDEECDDGNRAYGDGCSKFCAIEE